MKQKVLSVILLVMTVTNVYADVAASYNVNSGINVIRSGINYLNGNLIVDLHITVSRDLKANESVELVPQLEDSLGNFYILSNIYINGWKQQIVYNRETIRKDRNSIALKRTNGKSQTIDYLRSIPFLKWMSNCRLSVTQKGCECCIYKTADTTFVTNFKISPEWKPSLAFFVPQVEAIKRRDERGSAYVMFPLNKTIILERYMNNESELGKITQSIDMVVKDTNVLVSCVSLHGYASPEGSFENNKRLAYCRTKALYDYIKSKYTFDKNKFVFSSTPEDWDGLKKLLNDTTFSAKEGITSIINKEIDPDIKEKKLRVAYPKEFSLMLRKWFPLLRHTDYIINYTVCSFTLKQAKVEYETNPKNLSLEEMYRLAQTYEVGSDDFNKLFTTAVLLYPNDSVANLNAACSNLYLHNVKSATIYLAKAKECPQKDLALGVFYLLTSNYEEAHRMFSKAKLEGLKEAEDNLKQMSVYFNY